SPGVEADGAEGFGRPTRLRPVAVPGRRAGRAGIGTAAGGVHRRPTRSGQHLLVLSGGAAGDAAAAAGGAMVQAPVASSREGALGRWWGTSGIVASRRGFGPHRPRPLDVLEECLYGEPQLLLHLLLDR